MVASGAHAIARLKKADVEAMLAHYDTDPVRALTDALRLVLEMPTANWPELIGAAGFSDSRAASLIVADEVALDTLASELNELRALERQ